MFEFEQENGTLHTKLLILRSELVYKDNLVNAPYVWRQFMENPVKSLILTQFSHILQFNLE